MAKHDHFVLDEFLLVFSRVMQHLKITKLDEKNKTLLNHEGSCYYYYYYYHGLQASAPEGACHDNVKSLWKNIIQLLDFHLQIFRHVAEKHISSKNPTNENSIKVLFIYQIQHLLSKLHLSMTHVVSGFIAQI